MSNDWFFEKFALIADAPGAVERMRNIVLQLAVTGQLVPQEPTDEPASELTKKALSFVDNGVSSAQRARDIGKWKTVVDSGLSELPLGWTWTCNAVIGNTSPRVSVSDDALVAFVPMNVIPKDYRESLNPEIRLWTEIKRGYTHFADGDIVVAKITPCFQNGKAYVMKDLPGGVGAGTTELHVLRPVPNTVILLYMLLIFKSPEFVNGGVASFTGTAGQQRVSTDYFRYCPIPLPPLAEQKRIVAKVEELMGICDALEAQQQERESRKSVLVRASLSRFAESPTPENLGYLFHKSYDIPPSELRKSILTLAVQGKLVPQDPNDEPAGKDVAAARRQRGLPMATMTSEQLSNVLFEAPTSWCWVTVNDVAENRLGKMLDEEKNSGTPQPYLRNTNVHWFYFDLNSIKTILMQPQEINEFRLARGDVMICEGGHGIARTAVWEDQIPGVMFQKALHRIRPFECLNPYFFAFCIRVYESLGTLAKYYTGAGIPHFTGRSLAKLVFPLPPLAEQRRIVAKVDQLMALVDELERQQETSRENASKLLDAIVQEMTSGGRDISATLES